jgi:hypothetical protein
MPQNADRIVIVTVVCMKKHAVIGIDISTSGHVLGLLCIGSIPHFTATTSSKGGVQGLLKSER